MKRLFDIVFSASALLLLLPVLLVLVLLVFCRLGSPVLFTQIRPGRGGQPFRMLKFRTMLDSRGPDGKLLPDSARLTPFGRFLRSTSFDELPELWNVLVGEMSIVGPRPLLMEYLPLYTPKQARRHEVRPGITGWAQVNGRNSLSWEEKFSLDEWYVDNRTFWLDIKIIMATIMRVLKRDQINAADGGTPPKFTGTPDPT